MVSNTLYIPVFILIQFFVAFERVVIPVVPLGCFTYSNYCSNTYTRANHGLTSRQGQFSRLLLVFSTCIWSFLYISKQTPAIDCTSDSHWIMIGTMISGVF